MSNETVNQLRQQIEMAHGTLTGTMADVTPEQASYLPGGLANPIGAQFLHTITSEDGVVNGLIQGGAPLFASTFAGRAGFDTPPPMAEEGLADWHEWAQTVNIDLEQAREYAAAVYEKTASYLEGLSDQDLAAPLTHPAVGETNVGYMLNIGVLANHQWHCGEISCLKGIQGAKGYEF